MSGGSGGGDDIPDVGTNGHVLTKDSGASLGYAWAAAPGAGGGAPTSSAFVTIGNDAGLSAERALLDDGTTVQHTDAGAGTNVTTSVRDNGISNAKLRDSAALSVIGRSANTSGDPADIAGTDGQVMRVSGTVLGFGTVATAGVADAAVTLAKLANLAQDQFIGRTTASTGVPQTATITAAARTVLDDATVAAMVDTLGGAASSGSGGLARLTSPAFTTPNIGTATGSVSGNAGTVTTNANLTGPVTSSGNATAIADGAIALAKLANGTAGNVVTYSAGGVITVAATGTATHVLTSNGAGAAPTFQAAAGGGISDGDKGDITVSASGATWTIDAGAVTLADLANLAQDQFIGRVTASTGVPETATITAAARTVLDDATVAAMVDTLGGAASSGSGGLARLTSPAFVTPNIGTATGSVSGNSGTVTTNANLTGPVTSSGNATAIADKAIALAKLADGTAGNVVAYNASGVISAVATGTATHVLTSNGAGAAPTFQASAGGGISDGDKGDITVSASGATWTIDAGAVTLADLANLAQDQFIGRTTASTGVPETATITAAARTVVDDATVADMVTTLGGAASSGSGGLARLTSPAFTTPNIGTATGSVSGNAGTVTTNANLTGPVTSSGNATAIADGAIALAKLANGTAGNVVTYSAAGVITVAATGTATHVLTSNGAGAAPTFQVAAGGGGARNIRTLGIINEEFLGNTIAASNGWSSQTNSGTVTTNLTSDNTANHWGIVSLSTSTSATAQPLLLLQLETFIFNGSFVGEWLFRTPAALSSAAQRYILYLGLSNSANGVPNQGAYLSYSDDENAGNWMIKAADGGGTTTTNSSSVVAANTWYAFKMVSNSGGTNFEGFIAVDGGAYASLGTVSANIPAGRLGPVFYMRKTVGTTASILLADAFYCEKTVVR